MLHSVYAASALTLVMIVTMPFLSGTGADEQPIDATGSSGSSAPLLSSPESRAGSDDSSVPFSEFVERHTGSTADSSDGETRTAGAAQATGGTASADDASGETAAGATTGGSTASGGTTAGGTTGGTPSAETPAPTPSTPPPAVITPPAPPPAPVCPGAIGGSAGSAPSRTSALGVAGTTTDDLQSFAQAFNAIRVANCLPPVPFANFRHDPCMEDRLFWMAEDPSTDPLSAWGHIGSIRSDGVPSIGCDGNLAGGSGNTGATVAQKWWDSASHRTSLYKPTVTGSTASVCILFAMTHGGVPNEPYSFTRAAARWITC